MMPLGAYDVGGAVMPSRSDKSSMMSLRLHDSCRDLELMEASGKKDNVSATENCFLIKLLLAGSVCARSPVPC